MIRVTQHLPSFVTGFEPETAEVASLKELLELPWVKQWEAEHFHRWSRSVDGRRTFLMAELNEGKEWWVVAYLDGGDVSELTKWKHPGDD